MKKKILYFITSICLALITLGFIACKDDNKNSAQNEYSGQSESVENSLEEHIHVWDQGSFSDILACGKCVEKTYFCECGLEKTENVLLPDHSFTYYVSDNNEWCDKNATKTAVCDNEWCQETNTVEIPNSMTGHHGGSATCQERANCAQCGKPYGELVEHDFRDYEYNNDATCEEDGTQTAECAYGCGETDTKRAFSTAFGHAGPKGTCTTRSTCDRCGKEFGGYFHRFTNYVYNNDAKCEVDGTKTAVCDYGCGTTDTVTQPGSALKHIFEEYTLDNNATCETDETQTSVCQRENCERTNTVSIEGTALGHTYGDYVSDNNGKCEENGTESAACVNGCGKKLTQEERWSNIGHNFVGGVCTACGAKASVGLEYEFDDYSQCYSVTGIGTCTDKALLIPSEYNGYPVCAVADDSFNRGDLYQLEKVVLPNTITYVGANAFACNAALKTVLLSKNLRELGAFAFYDCFVLEKCPLPDRLTKINSFTFSACGKLTTIEWSKNLTEIGNDAFSYSGVQNVVIPDTVTYIGPAAFSYCEDLISVEIPDSITKLDTGTFQECPNLESVKLSSNLYNIGAWVFRHCASLSEITFPETLSVIGVRAFMDCESLQTLDLPDKMISIGQEAFVNCLSIETVVIPKGLTLLGYWAFQGCENLKKVILPEGFLYLDTQPFIYCSNLEEINFPEGLQEIGSNEFLGCEKLKDVNLPDSVTAVSAQSFSATEWFNDKSNWTNGVLYSGKHLIAIDLTVGGAFNVPDGVLTIADDSFQYDAMVTEVYIPASVSNVTSFAFWCTKLEKITVADENVKYFCVDGNLYERDLNVFGVPNGRCTLVKFASSNPMKTYTGAGVEGLNSIETRAFSNSQYLEEVIMPESVTSVSYYAFTDCAALKKVTFAPNIGSLRQQFYDCPNLEEIILPENLIAIYDYFIAFCPKLKALIVPDSVQTLSPQLVHDSEGLEYVVLGKNLKNIYIEMFKNCPALNSNGGVFYKGTREDFLKINILGEGAFPCRWFFYSEEPPTEDGYFWHYVDGVPTAWECPEAGIYAA